MCYKCNKPRHIAKNYRAPESQNGTNQRRNAPICQLCNNFKHTVRYCRMDKRNFNKNPNYIRNNNKNDKGNGNSSDKNQKEEIKEHVGEFNEAFVKANDLEISYTLLEE